MFSLLVNRPQLPVSSLWRVMVPCFIRTILRRHKGNLVCSVNYTSILKWVRFQWCLYISACIFGLMVHKRIGRAAPGQITRLFFLSPTSGWLGALHAPHCSDAHPLRIWYLELLQEYERILIVINHLFQKDDFPGDLNLIRSLLLLLLKMSTITCEREIFTSASTLLYSAIKS